MNTNINRSKLIFAAYIYTTKWSVSRERLAYGSFVYNHIHNGKYEIVSYFIVTYIFYFFILFYCIFRKISVKPGVDRLKGDKKYEGTKYSNIVISLTASTVRMYRCFSKIRGLRPSGSEGGLSFGEGQED